MSNVYDFLFITAVFQQMLRVTLGLKWLLNALSPIQKREILPRLIVSDKTVSVQHFYAGGAGMRGISQLLTSGDNMSLEISETVQRFLHRCSAFKSVEFQLEGHALTLAIESSCSALQYKVPYVKLVDNVFVCEASHIELHVPGNDWLNVWKTIPVNGDVALECLARKRSITLKHSQGRWAGGVHAVRAPDRTLTFECDSRVAKLVFADCVAVDTFSSLLFMSNGVMCWKDGDMTVFLAPNEKKNP